MRDKSTLRKRERVFIKSLAYSSIRKSYQSEEKKNLSCLGGSQPGTLLLSSLRTTFTLRWYFYLTVFPFKKKKKNLHKLHTYYIWFVYVNMTQLSLDRNYYLNARANYNNYNRNVAAWRYVK